MRARSQTGSSSWTMGVIVEQGQLGRSLDHPVHERTAFPAQGRLWGRYCRLRAIYAVARASSTCSGEGKDGNGK
jgi:hypothetical protein